VQLRLVSIADRKLRSKLGLRIFATAMLGFPFRSQLSPLRTSLVAEVGKVGTTSTY